jgi:transcriptional regulator with XRE-family HTH domain
MPSQPPLRMPLVRSMKSRGISANALAKLTGLHPGTISRLRTGRQSPNRVTVSLLVEALNCSAAELGLTATEGGAA